MRREESNVEALGNPTRAQSFATTKVAAIAQLGRRPVNIVLTGGAA